jgi:hypothetical protein
VASRQQIPVRRYGQRAGHGRGWCGGRRQEWRRLVVVRVQRQRHQDLEDRRAPSPPGARCRGGHTGRFKTTERSFKRCSRRSAAAAAIMSVYKRVSSQPTGFKLIKSGPKHAATWPRAIKTTPIAAKRTKTLQTDLKLANQRQDPPDELQYHVDRLGSHARSLKTSPGDSKTRLINSKTTPAASMTVNIVPDYVISLLSAVKTIQSDLKHGSSQKGAGQPQLRRRRRRPHSRALSAGRDAGRTRYTHFVSASLMKIMGPFSRANSLRYRCANLARDACVPSKA